MSLVVRRLGHLWVTITASVAWASVMMAWACALDPGIHWYVPKLGVIRCDLLTFISSKFGLCKLLLLTYNCRRLIPGLSLNYIVGLGGFFTIITYLIVFMTSTLRRWTGRSHEPSSRLAEQLSVMDHCVDPLFAQEDQGSHLHIWFPAS